MLEGAALAALLGIPPGPLPALAGSAGGACALGGLLLGSLALPPALRRAGVCAVLLLAAAMGLCAAFARQAGVPGDLWTLDAYAALPLPMLAQGWTCAGLLTLALVSLWGLWRATEAVPAAMSEITPSSTPGPTSGSTPESLSARVRCRLWLWAALGVWVALFWPTGLTAMLPVPLLPGIALDVGYFFAKLFCLSLALTWARRAAQRRW